MGSRARAVVEALLGGVVHVQSTVQSRRVEGGAVARDVGLGIKGRPRWLLLLFLMVRRLPLSFSP
jgi:hypothetical protein